MTTDSTTVYVSIGNSDDKLTQHDWAKFVFEFSQCMKAFATETYGFWLSEPSSTYQNACAAIATTEPLELKAALTSLRRRYQQDSVAWAEVPQTEFI